MWAEFTDHSGRQCLKPPVGDLGHQKIALDNDSSGVNNGNNVNKASSPSTGANVNNGTRTPSSSAVGDGVMNVSRNSSRSVVPTAAVLAAELLKRSTPLLLWGSRNVERNYG